jgi:hypothetical protein
MRRGIRPLLRRASRSSILRKADIYGFGRRGVWLVSMAIQHGVYTDRGMQSCYSGTWVV